MPEQEHKQTDAEALKEIQSNHAMDEASSKRVAAASNAHVQNIIDSVLKESSPSEAKSVLDALQQMAVDMLKFPNASDDIPSSKPTLVALGEARQLWEQALTLAGTDDKVSLKTQLNHLWGTLHRLQVEGTEYALPVEHSLGFAKRAFELVGK